jgi:hypothetical protein
MTRLGSSLGNSADSMRSRRAAIPVWLLAAALSVGAAGIAVADDPQSPPGASAAQPVPPAPQTGLPAQPPAANSPGFLHQLGVWWNDGFADFNAKMKNAKDKLDEFNNQAATQDALKNAAQATKDAATAVVRLPGMRVFELHDRCPPAGNGAPDCEMAAANACHGKGFSSGKPLDVSTSQECPARVVLSGQQPSAVQCHDETVILRVVCQ